jgi:hypothetical protein
MKSFRSCGVLALVLVALTLQTNRAAELVWTNLAGGTWSTAANWSPNQIPAAADSAFITNSGTYTVTVNATANIANLTLGDTNATGIQKLTVSAGTFTVTNVTAATNSILLLSAGTLVTSGAAELLGEVNQAAGTWQLNTPINLNTYNLTNGELRGANCVITNFNWLGGSLNSDALGNTVTIAPGGTLTISGPTAKYLSAYVGNGRTLFNNGTATWSAGIAGYYGGQLVNNGTMTITSDFSLAWGGLGSGPYLINYATLILSTGADLGLSSVNYYNAPGAGIYLNTGSITFTGCAGTNAGLLNLDAGSFVNFDSGSLRLDGSLVSPAGDHLRLRGMTVDLVTTNITTPSLLLTTGILNQNTNIAVDAMNQANGTWQLNVPTVLNNYNLTNGELRGANLTITNFNWLGGSLNSDALGNTVTVPASGTLNISSATAKYLSAYVGNGRTLNNHGTATWSSAGIAGYYGPAFNNSGTLTLTGDFSLAWGGVGAAPILNNSGTLTKTSGSGSFTLSTAILNNSATANIDSGSLNITGQLLNSGSLSIANGSLILASSQGTSTNTGTLTLGVNSFADFNSGVVTLDGSVVSPTANHIRFQGATINLVTTNLTTPALLLASGLLNQNTNVAVNTLNQNIGTWQLNVPSFINNYNLTNGELRGATCTITNFNWLGGSLSSDALGSQTFVPNGGNLNISGATAKALSAYVGNGRTLFNNGTATWSGAGITGYYGPQLINNGTMTLAGDFAYAWGGAGSGPYLINYTTLILASGSDLSLSSVNYYNAPGAGIYFNTGSITFTGCAGTNAGLLNLDAGSFVNFDSGTLRLDGNLVSPAGDHLRFRGMTVDLVTTNITTPSLLLAAGVLNQNTNVAVNTMNQNVGTWQLNVPTVIHNYNLTNGELRGANVTRSPTSTGLAAV